MRQRPLPDRVGGGIQIGVMGLDPEQGAPNVVVAIRTDGREQEITDLLGAIKKQAGGRPGPEPFSHNGVQVDSLMLGGPPITYAEVGSTLLLTLLPDDMKKVIDRAQAIGAGAA